MAINGKLVADSSKPLLCFVVGPIGKDGSPERKHADLLLNAVVKHVLEGKEFSYKVKRADEDADPGMIGDRVITDIIRSPLVIADLTDLNPNAFYELGIRHSTELPTIHIAKAGTALPFDNVAHRTIFVDLTDWQSIEQARSRLAESARAITATDYKVSNPITQANASFKMRQSEDPRDRVIAEMQERMFTLENAISKHPPVIEFPDNSMGLTTAIAAMLNRDEPMDAMKIYQQSLGVPNSVASDFIESVYRGKKIDAIKAHRFGTGASLRDAKDFVEAIGRQM